MRLANEEPIVAKNAENLELSLCLGSASSIYAEENFTGYISIKNKSSEPLYIYNWGILATTEFNFEKSLTMEAFPQKESKAKKIIRYVFSIPSRFKKAYTAKEKQLDTKEKQLDTKEKQLDTKEKQLDTKEKQLDTKEKQLEVTRFQKTHTAKEIQSEVSHSQEEKKYWAKEHYKSPKDMNEQDIDKLPKKLCPEKEEAYTVRGATRESVFFHPDKYKLTLYVDYANTKNEFFRDFKVEEISVYAPLWVLIYGAIIGGLVGGILVRILTAKDENINNLLQTLIKMDFLNVLILRNVIGLFAAVLFGVIVVIAFSRKTGAQNLVTIQDFWGGVFIGFLVGYSGKTVFEKLISIS
jgi:hypothetical protein